MSCRVISDIFVAVSALSRRSLVSRLSNPFMLPTSQLGLRYPLERILPFGFVVRRPCVTMTGTTIRMVLFFVTIKDFAAMHNNQRMVVHFGNENANIHFLPEHYPVAEAGMD